MEPFATTQPVAEKSSVDEVRELQRRMELAATAEPARAHEPAAPAAAEEEEEDDGCHKHAPKAPVSDLLTVVFAKLDVPRFCPGASVEDAASFLAEQHGLPTVGALRAARARSGAHERPLTALGRRLLRTSRLPRAQQFLTGLKDAVEAECDAPPAAAPAEAPPAKARVTELAAPKAANGAPAAAKLPRGSGCPWGPMAPGGR